MKTDEEIVARIKRIKSRDWLGFEVSDLTFRLPFALAEPFLDRNIKESSWKVSPKDRGSILKEMTDYLPFAWDKVSKLKELPCRITMCHYSAWIWLLGDDLGDIYIFEDCGREHLIRICKHYGWDYHNLDNGNTPS